MDEQIRLFLRALEQALANLAAPGERLDLYHIGRTSLILHQGLSMPAGGTRDFDIVQMRTPLEEKAAQLFGKGSEAAQQLGLYLELVPQGLPPVPQWFCARCTEVPGGWRVLRLWQPEPHDLAATKLKCFRRQDREDLQFLCDRGLLKAGALRQSLESAFAFVHEKDGDRAFANLERVLQYLEGAISSL
jgi:hypothetical protein